MTIDDIFNKKKRNIKLKKQFSYSIPYRNRILMEVPMATVEYLKTIPKKDSFNWLTGIYAMFNVDSTQIEDTEVSQLELNTKSGLLEIDERKLLDVWKEPSLSRKETDLFFNYNNPYCIFPIIGKFIDDILGDSESLLDRFKVLRPLFNEVQRFSGYTEDVDKFNITGCSSTFDPSNHNECFPFGCVKIWPKSKTDTILFFNSRDERIFIPFVDPSYYLKILKQYISSSDTTQINKINEKLNAFNESKTYIIKTLFDDLIDQVKTGRKYALLRKNLSRHLVFFQDIQFLKNKRTTSEAIARNVNGYLCQLLMRRVNYGDKFYNNLYLPSRLTLEGLLDFSELIKDIALDLDEGNFYIIAYLQLIKNLDYLNELLDTFHEYSKNKGAQYKAISLNFITYDYAVNKDKTVAEWKNTISDFPTEVLPHTNLKVYIPDNIYLDMKAFRVKSVTQILTVASVPVAHKVLPFQNRVENGHKVFRWKGIQGVYTIGQDTYSSSKNLAQVFNVVMENSLEEYKGSKLIEYLKDCFYNGPTMSVPDTRDRKECHQSMLMGLIPDKSELVDMRPYTQSYNWRRIYPKLDIGYTNLFDFVDITPMADKFEMFYYSDLLLLSQNMEAIYGIFNPVAAQLSLPVVVSNGDAGKFRDLNFQIALSELLVDSTITNDQKVQQIKYLSNRLEPYIFQNNISKVVIRNAFKHPHMYMDWVSKIRGDLNMDLGDLVEYDDDYNSTMLCLNDIVHLKGVTTQALINYITKTNCFHVYWQRFIDSFSDSNRLIKARNEKLKEIEELNKKLLECKDLDFTKEQDISTCDNIITQINNLRKNKKILEVILCKDGIEVSFQPNPITDPRTGLQYDLGVLGLYIPVDFGRGKVSSSTGISLYSKSPKRYDVLKIIGDSKNANTLNDHVDDIVDQIFDPINVNTITYLESARPSIYAYKASVHSAVGYNYRVCLGNYESAVKQAMYDSNILGIVGLYMNNAESANVKDTWGDSIKTFTPVLGKYSVIDLSNALFQIIFRNDTKELDQMRAYLDEGQYANGGVFNSEIYFKENSISRIVESTSLCTVLTSNMLLSALEFLYGIKIGIKETYGDQLDDTIKLIISKALSRIVKPYEDKDLDHINACTKIPFINDTLDNYFNSNNLVTNEYHQRTRIEISNPSGLNFVDYSTVTCSRKSIIKVESLEEGIKVQDNLLFALLDEAVHSKCIPDYANVVRFMPKCPSKIEDLYCGYDIVMIKTASGEHYMMVVHSRYLVMPARLSTADIFHLKVKNV